MTVPIFLGKRLLFVTAHPDDESYACAGTIWKNCQSGGESFLICASLGEQGKSHLDKTINTARLKKIRKAELKKACSFLQIKKCWCFNLPDTKIKPHASDLKTKLEAIVAKLKPDFIFSFGRDGLTSHTDHIAVGMVVCGIAEKQRIPFVKFYAPPSFYRHYNSIKRRRKFGHYAPLAKYPKPNLKLKVNPRKKLQAITLHQSQLEQNNPFAYIPKPVRQDILNYEYFKISPG